MKKKIKMQQRNRIILASSFIVVISAAIFATWVIISPNWSFEVTTDKSVYNLGENVQITVTLKNRGYIPHSFISSINTPVVVSVEYVSESNPTLKYQVWYTPFQQIETTFTVSSNRPLIRSYIMESDKHTSSTILGYYVQSRHILD